MKTHTSITLKTIQGALLITTLMLSACAKRSSYDSSSSRVDTQNSDKTYAICSQGKDIKTSTGFTITLQAIANPQGGYYPDWTALALSQVPEKFKTENQYIQFWRWKASSNSEVNFDSTAPLSFNLIRADTNQYIANSLTQISWEELHEILVNNNLPASTLTEAIDQIRFMINTRDVELTYDVLRANLYSSDSNASQVQVDALIPAFDANPNEYQYLPLEESGSSTQVARPNVLMQLHPFYSLMNQSWSNADYQSQATALCNSY